VLCGKLTILDSMPKKYTSRSHIMESIFPTPKKNLDVTLEAILDISVIDCLKITL
jgi:hypothetical protein